MIKEFSSSPLIYIVKNLQVDVNKKFSIYSNLPTNIFKFFCLVIRLFYTNTNDFLAYRSFFTTKTI